MHLKRRMTLAMVAAGLAWAPAVFAQSSGAGGAGAGDGTPLSQRRLEGRVERVDPQNHALFVTINGQSEAKKLSVAPNAHVIRDGLSVPLADVRPGDQLEAVFPSDDLARTRPWQLEARSPDGRRAPWGASD